MEEIFQVLQKYHSDIDDNRNETLNVTKNESPKNLKNNIERFLAEARCNIGSVEYANLNKMLATCYLKIGNELKAICNLIESHAVMLRQQILHRYAKTEMREKILNVQQVYGLKSSYVDLNLDDVNSIDNLKARLFDLPKEWYTIQITGQYQSPDINTGNKSMPNTMHKMHITILPTGTKDIEPLCITLPKPKLDSFYDVCHEIQKILSNNRSELEATYANNKLYWKMRNQQNISMKTAIQALEYKWLREWRILLVADPIDKLDVVEDIVQMINKLVLDSKKQKSISKRSMWLLKKVALTACFLTREEIACAIKYVISDDNKLADNIILSIYGKLSSIQELKNAVRKTLVLIIDEHMDYIPFESMEIVKSHPITRFPSLHIAYALFNEHKNTIRNGCKIIKIKKDMGMCIVNPSGNLSKMEKRMKLFIEYWLPNWRSMYHVEPQVEVFEDALINNDILMYNGHGNGIQYLPGEQIERLRVKAVVLLFGCSSVKLLPIGGRFPPYGISNQYLIATSPCILGMLWEVTDADIDKMTTNFISSWIPSPLNRSWADVDFNTWCEGTLKFLDNSAKYTQNIPTEPEMLRAVAKSKDVCSQYMTAAAIVVRGLPIKLV
ncbi:extra spindle pole bodies like 1, separase isoform X2 [Nomia melanderi]|uniref:extra spindle pole bodies like 1, separase isoform X2 n=1 Tax=Nomia melanderi TaxID=2448451 RepID=UPI001304202C|nr:separin isoform X2 [Nomia melanderi]